MLAFPPVEQIIRIDQRRRRIDQIVVSQRPPVDRLGRVLQAEMPDFRQGLVMRQRPDRPQLLQRRLN